MDKRERGEEVIVWAEGEGRRGCDVNRKREGCNVGRLGLERLLCGQKGEQKVVVVNKAICFVVFLVGFLTSSSATRLCRGRVPRLTLAILRAATHETERGDHDFCLSRSHYTDTVPTCRERVARVGIEP